MGFGLIVLVVAALSGFIAMVAGVVYSNYAVQKMRAILNQERAPDHQLQWHNAIQYKAQKVIDSYREALPDGPLSQKLKMGYSIAGVGGAVMIASAFMMKFTN